MDNILNERGIILTCKTTVVVVVTIMMIRMAIMEEEEEITYWKKTETQKNIKH